MAFKGVLGLLQKAYSLGFSAKRPLRGKNSSLAAVGVCPDKTYQNKPVPFWQVGSAERRDGWLGRAGTQSGETEQIGGLYDRFEGKRTTRGHV